MEPERERAREPESEPGVRLSPLKPPMKVETANKWMLLLTDYVDVAEEAAQKELEAAVNLKWNSLLDQGIFPE